MAVVDTKHLAETLDLTEEELIHEGVRSFLEEKLRVLTAEYRARCAALGVSSLDELDEKLRQGVVSEEESLDEFQRLDYLVEQIEHIRSLLEGI
jgi:hypothetical protein